MTTGTVTPDPADAGRVLAHLRAQNTAGRPAGRLLTMPEPRWDAALAVLRRAGYRIDITTLTQGGTAAGDEVGYRLVSGPSHCSGTAPRTHTRTTEVSTDRSAAPPVMPRWMRERPDTSPARAGEDAVREARRAVDAVDDLLPSGWRDCTAAAAAAEAAGHLERHDTDQPDQHDQYDAVDGTADRIGGAR